MHLRNAHLPRKYWKAVQANEPDIKQIFITGFGKQTETADRKLYIIRKRIENRIRKSDYPTREDFYIVSLSTKNIVYKGMLFLCSCATTSRPHQQLLHQRAGIGALPFQHQHFPTWGLAQPSACWHTTAKSIPSAATAAGWKPVKVYSPPALRETSGRYAPSCNRA